MTAQSQLEAYLGEFRQRLRALIVARGAALLALAALAITLVAVYFGIRRAFDPQIVYTRPRAAVAGARRHRRHADRVAPARSVSHARHPRDRAPRARLQRPPRNLRRHRARPGRTRDAVPGPARRRRAEARARHSSRAQGARAAHARARGDRDLRPWPLVWFASYGPANWRYGVRNLWAGWLLLRHAAAAAARRAARRRHGASRRGSQGRCEGRRLRAGGHDRVRAVPPRRRLGKRADDAGARTAASTSRSSRCASRCATTWPRLDCAAPSTPSPWPICRASRA